MKILAEWKPDLHFICFDNGIFSEEKTNLNLFYIKKYEKLTKLHLK